MRKTIVAALAAALMSSGAYAADVYNPGSTKDAGVFGEVKSSNRSGVYINGSLGYADIDRETSNSVTRDTGVTYAIPADASAEDLAEIADIVNKLQTEGVPVNGSVAAGGSLSAPVWIDRLLSRDGQDASGLIYGGGISYLWHRGGGIGVEVGIAADIYANGDTSSAVADAHPTIVGGYGSQPAVFPNDFQAPGQCAQNATTYCAGNPAGFSQNSWMSIDRQYDIDLPIKLHYFLNDRLSIYGGGGPSFAVASISGGTGGNYAAWTGVKNEYDNNFKDTDTSIGFVLVAGANWWMTDRVLFGIEGSYKQHRFEADGGKSTSVPAGNADFGSYRAVGQHIEADDEVFAVKAKIGIKLN